MTVEEFEEKRATLTCVQCGAGHLTTVMNPNNGGIRPTCVACGSSAPLRGVQWLKQQSATSRKVKRPSSDPSTAEVWQVNGDCCGFCGMTKEECERYHIGLTIQHVVPFVEGGIDGPMVPFCARCQEASRAALMRTLNLRRYHESLGEQMVRLQAKAVAMGRVAPEEEGQP